MAHKIKKQKNDVLYTRDGMNPKARYEVVPSVEGIVTKASVTTSNVISLQNLRRRCLELMIDKFDDCVFKISSADYRIDVGEKVKLYSCNGFEKRHKGDVHYLSGVQILDENGKVKFQMNLNTSTYFM